MRTDPFKSEEERFFWSMVGNLPSIIPNIEAESVISACYEPFVLRLSATNYTPDFMVYMQCEAGKLPVIFETKGSKMQKGYRDTRAKLSDAAALYPMFIFYEVLVDVKLKRFLSFELISPPPFPYIWIKS